MTHRIVEMGDGSFRVQEGVRMPSLLWGRNIIWASAYPIKFNSHEDAKKFLASVTVVRVMREEENEL